MPGANRTKSKASALIAEGQPFYGFRPAGRRFDCGNKLGYLQATVEYGLMHASVGPGFRKYLRDVSSRL